MTERSEYRSAKGFEPLGAVIARLVKRVKSLAPSSGCGDNMSGENGATNAGPALTEAPLRRSDE